MSVQLQPAAQLGFQRPLTQLVKRTLSVTNQNSQPIAYKVKTTAPKQYCVRPNSGRIEPGETVEVQVLLQPMKEDPAPGTKCRDKFLVQSVIVTPDKETASLPDLWSAVEKEDKAGERNLIHEQKIRCTYLPAADESGANGTILEEEGNASKISTNGSSGVDESSVPSASRSTGAEPATAASPSYDSSAQSTANTVNENATAATAAAGGVVAGAAAAVGLGGVAHSVAEKTGAQAPSTAASTTADVGAKGTDATRLAAVQAELASAQAEIARLKEHLALAESNAATLRSRGVGASASGVEKEKAGAAQAIASPNVQEGVPFQVVAGLVFGTFVVTWLFF